MNLNHKNKVKNKRDTNLRNFIFCVEDSLVSTFGLLAGVAAGGITRASIITTGLVLIVVEGLSMGIGSFLTEETADEVNGDREKISQSIWGGIVMLFSYCLAGILPLAPYMFVEGDLAIAISVTTSLLGLFLLGFGTSSFYKRPHAVRHGFKMLIMGGLAVFIGILVGKISHF